MKKKPTRLQYFFAQDWLTKIWLGGIPIFIAFVAVRSTDVTLASLMDWRSTLWTIAVIGISLLLGYFAAILVGWPVLGSLYYERELKNGGPFKVGDTVQILAGRHKGRISRVYSTWQGDSVRVELGVREKEEFKDIFAPTRLLKEDDAEQTHPEATSETAPSAISEASDA